MEFIETIYVKNGNILNLNLHIKRIKQTETYFKWKKRVWNLEKIINKNFQKNFRVRITYNQFGIQQIEYFSIKKRNFKKFKLIKTDFEYYFKYKKRNFFNNLDKLKYDEYIFIKNNLITDTTISNLAFYTGKEWITPKYPLLKGTKREELIKKGFLKEENIHISDLKYFKKIALINAILGFKEITEYDIII